MDVLEQFAFNLVGRYCGYALLAIFCVMISMADMIFLALQTAATLTTLGMFILIMKAQDAHLLPYTSTAIWKSLEKYEHPNPHIAQWLVSTIMEKTYLDFASHALRLSILLWFFALISTSPLGR
ncbi:MAG: hypothetical protein COB90_03110 [Hyphomicrobiales bacterium]|nr:MAG: hypothetical protein COB90_03110 [Hyphomicrobiales bacterium]